MSITYGFYNSLNGDRKYNATQLSRLFEGIVNDGVFASIGSALQVTAATGMTVNVGTGRAWFNNTWTDNDAILPLTIEQSDVVLNRIDAVVLEIGSSSDVRENTIKVVKGTAASSPVNPTLIKTTGQYQYPLAYVYVGAGVISITQDKITSRINTTECPTVKVVGVDGLIPLWEDEFNAWFADLQAQMSGDVASNLQNQINTNKNTEIANKTKYATCTTASSTAAKVATQAEFSLTTGVIVGVKFTNANTAANMTLNINNTGAKAVYYSGAPVGSDKISVGMLALFQYDGTYWQLLNPADYAVTTYLSAALQALLGVGNVDSALLGIMQGKLLNALLTGFSKTSDTGDILATDTLIKALSRLSNNLDALKIVTGTYTGDYAIDRTINIGFTPKMVFICYAGILSVKTIDWATCYSSNGLKVVTNGFKVGTEGGSRDYTNGNGVVYTYYALR